VNDMPLTKGLSVSKMPQIYDDGGTILCLFFVFSKVVSILSALYLRLRVPGSVAVRWCARGEHLDLMYK
jgi:hypothetical protein